jgi:hypothetical protein
LDCSKGNFYVYTQIVCYNAKLAINLRGQGIYICSVAISIKSINDCCLIDLTLKGSIFVLGQNSYTACVDLWPTWRDHGWHRAEKIRLPRLSEISESPGFKNNTLLILLDYCI